MKTVMGDILTINTTDYPVLVCHQVNCQGVMGSGLAKQIKDRFPIVFQVYRDKCRLIHDHIGGLGDVQYCSVISEAGYIIANIFSQDSFGRDKQYTDYGAMRSEFQDIARGYRNYTVRIPYLIGCGLGGGDWNVVSQIIQEELIDRDIDVEIWRLNKV